MTASLILTPGIGTGDAHPEATSIGSFEVTSDLITQRPL